MGLVATFLMIYGSFINGFFKKITKKLPFLGRFALFVLLCSVGYAFLSSQIVKLLKKLLYMQSDGMLIIIVAAAFIGLAFLARSGKDV